MVTRYYMTKISNEIHNIEYKAGRWVEYVDYKNDTNELVAILEWLVNTMSKKKSFLKLFIRLVYPGLIHKIESLINKYKEIK